MCLKSFDELHHKYRFYTTFTNKLVSSNSMVASEPGNKIFLDTLEIIRNNWSNSEEIFSQGFQSERRLMRLAIYRTMLPFSNAVEKNIDTLRDNRGISLPSSYLFPEYPKLTNLDKFLHLIDYDYEGTFVFQAFSNLN